MEKLIFQKFIFGTGEYLDKALSKGLGGVIFFTRDIESDEQFKKLISDIKSKAAIPPFLSIDQEGGRVERTEKITPKRLSARYAWKKGITFLKNQTEEMAKELEDFGINLNFAPVADVNTNPNNPIIGERAFSDVTDEVITCVKTVADVYRNNGIIPCVKHYPGHGDADKDSHKTLPCIDLSQEEMEKVHIRPFKEAINDDIEMIMAAHLHCTCFDKTPLPSSLSKNAIGYLREKLNYNGVIISDDMVMQGVQDFGTVEAIIMGINAGLDMFIFRDADQHAYSSIEKLVEIVKTDINLQQKIIESNRRIENLKKKFFI